MPEASEFSCEEGMCTGSWSCALWKPLSDHTDDPGSNPGKAIPGAEVSDHMVLTEWRDPRELLCWVVGWDWPEF